MSYSVVAAVLILLHQDASFRLIVKTAVGAAHKLPPQRAVLC